MLKPQDIVVLLKLVSAGDRQFPIHELAVELGMSPSEVHQSLQRAQASKLLLVEGSRGRKGQNRHVGGHSLTEFLLHGIKYAFPPELGTLTRGMPTAYAAPVFGGLVESGDPPPVWPDIHGPARGVAFEPLHRSAPEAARKDPKLYDLLALVDAIRGGRARERNFAAVELKKRIEKRAA